MPAHIITDRRRYRQGSTGNTGKKKTQKNTRGICWGMATAITFFIAFVNIFLCRIILIKIKGAIFFKTRCKEIVMFDVKKSL